MRNELINTLSSGEFRMTLRPAPVAGDLRLAWGVALLVLLLGHCRARTASFQKLHFLAHAIRTAKSRAEIEEVFAGSKRSSDVVVRIEPWLNRAIAFAKGGGLIELHKGKSVRLTSHGSTAFRALVAVEDIFSQEKAFLQAVGKTATEGAVDRIVRMEFEL